MTTAPVLDPSAARAATVELYAAARPAVNMAGLSSAELVEFIGECQAGIRSLQAAQTLAMARMAATEEVVLEDGTIEEVSQGLGYRRLDAPDQVSETLGLSAQQAGPRVEEAVILAAKLPSLVDAMGAGRIDAYRAGVIADELREAPRAVCDEVLARLDGSLGKPVGMLRARTRRALEVVDKQWLVTKTRRARSALGLRMVTNDDSTDTWTAIIPTEESREAWAAVEPLAKAIRETEGCTLDVARAKAMMQLMLGNCTGTFHVHFAVPADQAEDFAARFTTPTPDPGTSEASDGDIDPEPDLEDEASGHRVPDEAQAEDLGAQPQAAERRHGSFAKGVFPDSSANASNCDEGHAADGEFADAPATARDTYGSSAAQTTDDEPVVVTGMGTAGTTIVPRGWVDDVLAGRHGNVEADVIGCDPATGGFVTDPIPIPIRAKTSPQGRGRPGSMATTSYHPTSACRAYVKARDQRCRFPGCTTSAYFTDLDHVRAWPAGPTDPRNLACLCRRHHRIKQRPGWTVRLNPDGSMDWTDPTGRVRTTHPVDHLGTTLPTASAMPGDHRNNWVRSSPSRALQQEAGFGDAIWDGDYQNPDSYTGGIPVDLAITRELRDDFEAWYDQPPPEESGLRRQLREEYGWADEWWGEPPEPQPRAISWISCRPPRERHTK